jgi:hypothetical protein
MSGFQSRRREWSIENGVYLNRAPIQAVTILNPSRARIRTARGSKRGVSIAPRPRGTFLQPLAFGLRSLTVAARTEQGGTGVPFVTDRCLTVAARMGGAAPNAGCASQPSPVEPSVDHCGSARRTAS